MGEWVNGGEGVGGGGGKWGEGVDRGEGADLRWGLGWGPKGRGRGETHMLRAADCVL